MKEFKEKLDKTIDVFYESIRNIRSGAVSIQLIDGVRINGQPISHTSVTSGGGNIPITIRPYSESPQVICDELKKQGFNAYLFSKDVVCVSVPPISGEEKERVKKYIKGVGEKAKISIRQLRQKYRKIMDDDKEIQKYVDVAINEVDELTNKKIQEL